MQIKYFPDTDTLLIAFADREIVDTKDVNENILVELDSDGELVSMTVEHAKNQMDVDSVSFQRVVSDSRRVLVS
jgi:uncharacterized protein YuzE